MATILIAEDDLGLRSALKEILSLEGHKIIEAENGKRAKEFIQLQTPDLVISDFQMPFMDGLELLQWTKLNTKIPFILMTAFGHIVETKRAFDEGADDFFPKPFKNADIVHAVQRCLTRKQVETAVDKDRDFCRIPIEDFVSGADVRIGIFIRLSKEKYVRVAHKGDSVALDRIEHYRTKGVDYLYASKEEFAFLVGFNLKVAKAISATGAVSIEKRQNFLRYTTETVMENIIVNGINKDAFAFAKECMTIYLQVVSESDGIFKMMEALNAHANWIYAHGLGVSVYSVMIGNQLGWRSSSTHFRLGISGLLHDVGIKEIDLRILEKSRLEHTQQERHLYETHPTRSKELLNEVKEIPGDIAHIVFDHHESSSGQGYPRRITKQQIHPLAKIVSVADAFCYRALKGPNSSGSGAREAVDYLKRTHSDELDSKSLAALSALCG